MQRFLERLEIALGLLALGTGILLFGGAVMLWFEIMTVIERIFPG